jgi:ribosomal protein S27AE
MAKLVPINNPSADGILWECTDCGLIFDGVERNGECPRCAKVLAGHEDCPVCLEAGMKALAKKFAE